MEMDRLPFMYLFPLSPDDYISNIAGVLEEAGTAYPSRAPGSPRFFVVPFCSFV
jgi:hypothetical protein